MSILIKSQKYAKNLMLMMKELRKMLKRKKLQVSKKQNIYIFYSA